MVYYVILLVCTFVAAILIRELLTLIGVSYVSCVQYVRGQIDRMVRSVNNRLAPQWEQVSERIDRMEKSNDVMSVLVAQVAQLTALVGALGKRIDFTCDVVANAPEQTIALANDLQPEPMIVGNNGMTIVDTSNDLERYLEDTFVSEQIAAMDEQRPEQVYCPPAPDMLSARSVRDPFTCKLVLASDNTIATITLDGGPFTNYGFHESTATYQQGRIGWYAGTGQLITWESRNTGKSMVGVVLGVDSATGHHVVCPVNDSMEKMGRITRKDLGKVRIIHAAPEPAAVSWSYAGQRQEISQPESTPEPEIEKPAPKVAPRNGKAPSKTAGRNPLVDATLLFGQGIKVRLHQPLIVLRDANGCLVREGSKIRWFSPTGKKGRDLPGLQRRFHADPIQLTYAEITQLVS